MGATDVPVLVVAFNRPERLRGLVDRLREVRPTCLYVAVDGPRAWVPGDAQAVQATRDVVGEVDWACDVRTLFREQNLGCGLGVSGALNWLFASQERGIVLEDDILPDGSLFPFCTELLERYADDKRVWAVSGCNFAPPENVGTHASYRFARVPSIWGWATWRRSWDTYSYSTQGWWRRLPPRDLVEVCGSPLAAAHWAALFELSARGHVDTWDFQAVLAAFASGGLTATSNVNLVENVGFGAGSTHTAARPSYLRPVERAVFPLRHPAQVVADAPSEVFARRRVQESTIGGVSRSAARFLRSRVRA